jgi:hypothetical protein
MTMPIRLSSAAWLAPVLAWVLLGLAAAGEGSTGCSTSDPRSDAAAGLFILGGAAALAGIVLSLWPFRTRRDLGTLGGGIAVAAAALAVVGLAVLPLLFAALLFGVWRIATADARGARRTRALVAFLVSSLWFPAAGIALLWAALRCFTF